MILVRSKEQILKTKYTYLACFDKDGTLVVDSGYVHSLKDFQWHINGLELLKVASQQNAAIVVVTNQSGISKKIFTKKQSVLFAKHLIKKAREERIFIKLIVICPHGEETSHKMCDCRKPLPGMYLKIKSFSWAKNLKSIMIGNTDTDKKFAFNSGIEYLDVNNVDSRKLLAELGNSLL
jgi:D-glycero-D-manno-heptose 1,7-bisphosphate phosphatase